MSSKPSQELPFPEEPLAPQPPSEGAGPRRTSRRPSGPRSSINRPLASSYNEMSEPGFRVAHLYVERGPGAGQLMPVRQGTLTIGRASVSDLRLLHPSISRHHAELMRRGERYFLRDLGSQNGTFVNRTRVADEVEIRAGDQLALGQAMLRLRVAGGAEDDVSIVQVLRNRWTLARWAVFAAAIATGFAAVSLWQVYRLTGIPVVEVTTQTELLPPPPPPVRVHPAPRPPKSTPRAQRAEAQPVPVEPAPAAPARAVVAAPAPAPVTTTPPARPVKRVRPVAVHATPARTRIPPSRVAAARALDPEPASAPGARVISTKSNFLAELEPIDTLAARYEGGDAAGALELAKHTGDSQAAQLLVRFRRVYSDAQRALTTRDVPEAKHQFEIALDLDSQLGHGRGWYHGEIRRHLSALNTLEGDRELAHDNASAARHAYREALSLNPSNRQARSKLEALEEEPFASAPLKIRTSRSDPRSSAIEEAFEKD